MKYNEIEIVEKELQRYISALIAVIKNPNIQIPFPTNSNDIKICIEDYALKNNLNEAERIDIYSKLANESRELTTLLYNAYYEILEESFKKKEQEMNQKLLSVQKSFYTVKEVVAMNNVFHIKTENTVGKKLKSGEIKGNLINGQWQISRQSLIDFVGHDKFSLIPLIYTSSLISDFYKKANCTIRIVN